MENQWSKKPVFSIGKFSKNLFLDRHYEVELLYICSFWSFHSSSILHRLQGIPNVNIPFESPKFEASIFSFYFSV